MTTRFNNEEEFNKWLNKELNNVDIPQGRLEEIMHQAINKDYTDDELAELKRLIPDD